MESLSVLALIMRKKAELFFIFLRMFVWCYMTLPLLKIGLQVRISPKNNLAEEHCWSVPSHSSPAHENQPKGVFYAVLLPLSALPISRSPLMSSLNRLMAFDLPLN